MNGLTTAEQPTGHPAIARLDAAAQRHNVLYQGRAVCWRRFGEGPPIVLIHGGHGNWMHWILNIEALAEAHTVWVPDLPGFGASDDLAGDAHAPERMQHLINALIGTLDTLVGRNALIDVAGFSFGGLVAAQLAVQRGDVRRLALIGSGGHGGRRRQRADLMNWRQTDRAAMLEALKHNLAVFMLHDPARLDELAMAVHEASCMQTRFRSKGISRAAGLKDVLERFACPLLFIWGEHDVTAAPDEMAPELAEARPNREWCLVPGAGHWVQYERANDVNQLLKAWFGSCIEEA